MSKLIEYKLTAIKNENDFESEIITKAESAYNIVKKFYSDDILIYESFFMLLLNRANYTIGWVKISQGGICATVVDIKILLKYTIDSLANGIILCHNHPSGRLDPSPQDLELTKKIKDALKLIDVRLHDHLIISDKGYYSFADEGMI